MQAQLRARLLAYSIFFLFFGAPCAVMIFAVAFIAKSLAESADIGPPWLGVIVIGAMFASAVGAPMIMARLVLALVRRFPGSKAKDVYKIFD